jgi:trehalose 6-phosphate phosphatase
VRIDKGAGIEKLLAEVDVDVNVALYAGDDTTDLDAFRTLGELVEQGKLEHAVRVGVGSEDGPAEITEAADVVVDGTNGVQELLSMLIVE